MLTKFIIDIMLVIINIINSAVVIFVMLLCFFHIINLFVVNVNGLLSCKR